MAADGRERAGAAGGEARLAGGRVRGAGAGAAWLELDIALLAVLLPSLLQFLLGLLAGVLLLLGLVVLHGDDARGEALLPQLAHDAHRVDDPDHRQRALLRINVHGFDP